MTRWRNHPLPSTAAVIVVQLAVLAIAVAASWFGVIWWQTLALGIATAVVLLLPVQGRLVLDWITTAVRRRREGPLPEPEITDSTAPDGSVTGIVWDGNTACTVIELAPSRGVTRLGRGVASDEHAIPLTALVDMFVQHDISLAGMDVVAHGRRTDPGSPTARAYDQLVGPLPATSVRTVWLVVRFDAADQAAAVASRGGGVDGISRSVSIASCRITRTLDALGTTARILSATEIRFARDLVRGGNSETSIGGWDHVSVADGRSSGGALDPRLVDIGALNVLWATRTTATTVTVRLRRSSRDVRLAASYRFLTNADRQTPRPPRTAPATGHESEALHSHLPGSATALDGLTGFATADGTALNTITVSTGGCGQLVGSDADGRGVAVRLVGSDIDRVDVIGEPYLARQVVLRAIAIGARVAVRSARPEEWLPLIGTIGDPERLALADVTAAVAGSEVATAVVCDGVDPPVLDRHVTVIRVGETHEPTTDAATVSIRQPGGLGNRIVLWVDGSRFDLTIVSTSSEAAFLGGPRTSTAPVAAQ